MNVRPAAGVLLLALLAGCGQLGPLYLPDETGAVTTVVPASTAPVAAGADAASPAPPPDASAVPDRSTSPEGAAPDAGSVPDRSNEPRRRAH